MLREPFEKQIITAEIKRVGYLKFSRFQNFVMLDCSSVKKISQISQMSRVEKKSYCQPTNKEAIGSSTPINSSH